MATPTFSLVLPKLTPSAARAITDFLRANPTVDLTAEVALPPGADPSIAPANITLTMSAPHPVRQYWPILMLLASGSFAAGMLLFGKRKAP